MAQTQEEKRAWRRKYYQQNKERLDAKHTKWVQEHREHLRAYHNTEKWKAYRRTYFREHKEHLTVLNVARAKRQQEWFQNYKRNLECSRCGESFPDCPGIIDFHHEGEGKEDYDHLISSMLKHNVPMARFKAELAKCVPVCANCHRIVHYLEKQNKKKGLVPVPKPLN